MNQRQKLVSVNNLSVRYEILTADDYRKRLKQQANREKRRDVFSRIYVSGLEDVSMELFAGDALGILGENGSGKSTLLRALAGLETPLSGKVMATEKPVLLGVSAALEPALSGYQNVKLGCLALGMTPKKVDSIIDDIVKFIDIGDQIYLPMQTYSSGMAARLRFAIATAAEPEILLVDEALSTGDAAFKSRSEEKMAELRKRAGAVVIVSHHLETIQAMCNRALWLHEGKVLAEGPVDELVGDYRQWARARSEGNFEQADWILSQYGLGKVKQRPSPYNVADPGTYRSIDSRRVGIYGSGVSYDIAERLSLEHAILEQRIPRLALASAVKPVNLDAIGFAKTGNIFEDSVLDREMEGDLFGEIKGMLDESDLVIWDINDERFGYFAGPNGERVTRTQEIIRKYGENFIPEGYRLIKFGSEEHFKEWRSRLAELLDHNPIRSERLALLQAKWDSTPETARMDQESPDFFPAALFNTESARYFSVAKKFGVFTIEVRDALCIYDPNHTRGMKQFHYVQDFYEFVVSRVADRLRQLD